MWVPYRPVPIKCGVGAMLTCLWITWTESHLGCSEKQGLNPCFHGANSIVEKVK